MGRLDALINTETYLATMGTVGTVNAIVNGLAEAVSAAEWKLYRTAASGKEEDRVQVMRHAALKAWRTPNPFMTNLEFVHAFQQHLELVGETDWLVGRSAGYDVPLELWPIRPDRIAPVEHPTKFMTEWTYSGPDGQTIPLRLDQVIQTKLPNPCDPYRGMGTLQSVMHDVDAARYSARWNRNFFLNGAMPGGVIEVPDKLSDPEWNEMQDRWESSHRGVDNAHRVAIIERGKWVPAMFSMRDMQFGELREVSREIIREAWRYPKAMLGTAEDVNRANAEAAEVMLARWLVLPRLRRIRDTLNFKFLPLFGLTATGLEFDFTSPVPEDQAAENAERDSKVAAYVALVGAGVEPDDASEYLDMPKMSIKVTSTVGPPVTDPALPPVPPEPAPEPAPAAHVHEHRVLPMLPMMLLATNATPRETDPAYLAYQAEIDKLVGDWSGITEAQRAEIHEQVTAAVDTGDITTLAALVVTTAGAGALLTASMISLFGAIAALTVADAAVQGVTITPAVAVASQVADVANVVVALMASGLADAAAREALRLTVPGATGSAVADQVDEHLAALSDDFLHGRLGGALWRAAAAGWGQTVSDALAAGEEAEFYASERLDLNTCAPCREVDGKHLVSWEAVVIAGYANNGGYLDCQGGERCRGRVRTVWIGVRDA
jgi:HK97 family phage portal protein